MHNPRTLAIVNAVVAVLFGYQIFFTTGTSSQLLNRVMCVFFGLSLPGLITAIVKLNR